jgi:hypothetical protein
VTFTVPRSYAPTVTRCETPLAERSLNCRLREIATLSEPTFAIRAVTTRKAIPSRGSRKRPVESSR